MKDQEGDTCLTYTVPYAGQMVGLSRPASYAAARRGDIPTIRFGKTLRVPKERWHRIIKGASSEASPGAAS